MFTTLYYTHIYYPFWGAITINKAFDRKARALTVGANFFNLFSEIKNSDFLLGHKVYYPNRMAEEYSNATFGNFLTKDIASEHFRKVERNYCFDAMQEYINVNFENSIVLASVQDQFVESVMSSIKFAVKNSSEFYQFKPDKTLKTIINETGGAYDHFTSYLILCNETIEDIQGISITLIKMFKD